MDNSPVSIEHYENFPVASILCPARLRAPILAIYRFARTADDLADEGDAPATQRLMQLRAYRRELDAPAEAPLSRWPEVFGPLRRAVTDFRLPMPLLHDLLDAFEQDCGNPAYQDRLQLLDYCRRSANPVGRLLLHLNGVQDAQALAQSDAICTALQLINFWQDPSVDLPRGRSYLSARRRTVPSGGTFRPAGGQGHTGHPGPAARLVHLGTQPDAARQSAGIQLPGQRDGN